MVSVIIPNYNHGLFLKQRIESVLNQTYQNFEIIILDDCSTDNSIDIINAYRNHPKVSHIHLNNENSGSTFRQWRKGIDIAIGEWVWIAESDDYCETDFLEKLLLSPKLDICGLRYCMSVPIDEIGEKINGFDYGYVKEGVYDGETFLGRFLLKSNAIPNASAVIIKNNVLKSAITSPNIDLKPFKLFGDWLIWIEVSLMTMIGYSEETRNYHRYHANTARVNSSRHDLYLKEQRLFRNLVVNILYGSQLQMKHQLVINNRIFSAHELGHYGCRLIRNGKIVKAIPLILDATFKLDMNMYYLRSACYWIWRRISDNNKSDAF